MNQNNVQVTTNEILDVFKTGDVPFFSRAPKSG